MENITGIVEEGLHLAFIGFMEEGIVLIIICGKDEVFVSAVSLSPVYPGGEKLYRRNPE